MLKYNVKINLLYYFEWGYLKILNDIGGLNCFCRTALRVQKARQAYKMDDLCLPPSKYLMHL